MAKRKPNTETLERKAPTREPYDIVLIVCEDEKSAKYYFDGLKNYYRLSSANIEIAGKECGSAPSSVLEYAKERARIKEFNKIFCVFDKDKHETYNETVKELKKLSNDSVWETALINSVPCFEYWYLLHFEYTTKPFNPLIKNKKGGSSEQVISELKKHIPDYEKSNRNMFQQLVEKLPFAIKNAEKSLAEAEKNQTDNPTTKVHLLVEYLQELKK